MLPFSITLPREFDPDNFHPPAWVRDVLLEHRDLARLGHLDSAGIHAALNHFVSLGKSCVLVWDVLADDAAISKGQNTLSQIDLTRISAIRVADPGIAQWLKRKLPQIEIQLSLETGNHNLPGIQAWIRAFQPQRIVLSNELPLGQMARIRTAIDVPVEISILGRLLLFYTPRHLLNAIDPEPNQTLPLARFVTSVEDGKHFPIEENRHGTFMFYEKDLFLLPYLDQITAAGLDMGRLDLKFFPLQPMLQSLTDYLQNPEPAHLQKIKACLGPRLTRGFFKSNKTDKQFIKLKNTHLTPREDRDFLGTVVETRKNQYIAQMFEKNIRIGEWITYQIPEGEFLDHQVAWIRDKDGQSVQQTTKPGLWLINHRSSISPGSKIYREKTRVDSSGI